MDGCSSSSDCLHTWRYLTCIIYVAWRVCVFFSVSRRWEFNSGRHFKTKPRPFLCWFVSITPGEVCILGLRDVRGVAKRKPRRRSSPPHHPFFPIQQSDLKMSSSVIICPRSWITPAERKELATYRLLWWRCTFLLKSSAALTEGRRASGWHGYGKTQRVAGAKNGGVFWDRDPAGSNRLTRAGDLITPDFSIERIDVSARGGWRPSRVLFP